MSRRLALQAIWCVLFVGGCGGGASKPPAAGAVPPTPAVYTGSLDEVVVLETDYGALVIELYPLLAPAHVNNFKQLVASGFYDGTRFHRSEPGGLIQGGCPHTRDSDRTQWGRGGPGYDLPPERSELRHERGTVSMAQSEPPRSVGSQFFICLRSIPHLDGTFSAFGKVVAGTETLDTIDRLPRIAGRAIHREPATVLKARIVPRAEAMATVE